MVFSKTDIRTVIVWFQVCTLCCVSSKPSWNNTIGALLLPPGPDWKQANSQGFLWGLWSHWSQQALWNDFVSISSVKHRCNPGSWSKKGCCMLSTMKRCRPGDAFSGQADFWELWTPAGCATVREGWGCAIFQNVISNDIISIQVNHLKSVPIFRFEVSLASLSH